MWDERYKETITVLSQGMKTAESSKLSSSASIDCLLKATYSRKSLTNTAVPPLDFADLQKNNTVLKTGKHTLVTSALVNQCFEKQNMPQNFSQLSN